MKKGHILGVLALIAVFSVTGFQCHKVTDPASDGLSEYSNPDYAPPFNASDFSSEANCQSACNKYYTGLLKDENAYHSDAMKGFKGNDPQVKQDRAEEIDRHKLAVAEIQDARRQCIRDCHDQGGVSGGF